MKRDRETPHDIVSITSPRGGDEGSPPAERARDRQEPPPVAEEGPAGQPNPEGR